MVSFEYPQEATMKAGSQWLMAGREFARATLLVPGSPRVYSRDRYLYLVSRRNALVIQSIKAPCHFCYAGFSADATACGKCARNLLDNLDLLHQPCRVVPDGSRFGIFYKGEIRIHGLSLGNAQNLAAIMNAALRDEDKN
jgi:hypothetical protein